MKIVIAPQGFKGGLTGLVAARAIRKGVLHADPSSECVLAPIADGGDGTLQALVDSSGGRILLGNVTDALGRPIKAEWGSMGDGVTAVIEMARCSGLAMLSADERDPLTTTTYGVGQLIKLALDANHRRFILGIGGSATNDGGGGMLRALGVGLLDESGNDIPLGGAGLARLSRINLDGIDPRIKDAEILVACDVNNPLCGPDGASAVFGPQKGASHRDIEKLDAALSHYAEVIRSDIGVDIKDYPGAGAAGGLGAGLMSVLGAKLTAGVDIVLDAVGFDDMLDGVELIITGEGQIDQSTVFNKAPVGVARLARKRSIPVVVIAGGLGQGFRNTHDLGINAAFSLVNKPMSLDEAMCDAELLLEETAEQIIRTISVGRFIGN